MIELCTHQIIKFTTYQILYSNAENGKLEYYNLDFTNNKQNFPRKEIIGKRSL